MGRRDHLKDYVPTGDGGYEYAGTRWSWPSEEARRTFLSSATAPFALAVACVVGAGCIPAPGTFGAFYVVIPFVIAVVGTALAGTSLFRLWREPGPLRDHVYSKSVPALPAKLLVGALGCGACAIAALVHGIALVVTGAEATILLSVVFSALLAFAAFCLARVRGIASGLVFMPDK